MDAFVAEFAQYLSSHGDRIDHIACTHSDWEIFEATANETALLSSVAAWKATHPNARICISRLVVDYAFARALVDLHADVSELLIMSDEHSSMLHDLVPTISKFGHLKELELTNGQLPSMDALRATVFPRLRHFDVSNVSTEDSTSCSRFFDELSFEPRASTLRHLYLSHPLDRSSATRLADSVQTNRVLEFISVTIEDPENRPQLLKHGGGVVFAQPSLEDLRGKAASLSVLDQESTSARRSIDSCVAWVILARKVQG